MQSSVREYFSSYTDAEYILIFVAAEVRKTIGTFHRSSRISFVLAYSISIKIRY